MINDGKCDPECNTENCGYDGVDCRCNDDCPREIWGQCDEKCMTASCKYDQYGPTKCANQDQILFYMHKQLIDGDLDKTPKVSDCTDRNPLCDLSKVFNTAICTNDCNKKECGYSGLKCPPESLNNCNANGCSSCYTTAKGDCYDCNPNKFQFFGYCLDSCPVGYSLTTISGTFTLCLPGATDLSTEANPAIYFVTSLTNSQTDLGGLGTILDPFQSIAVALASIHNKYAEIRLLDDGGDIHYLVMLEDKYVISKSVTNKQKPYNEDANRLRLKIIPNTPDKILTLKPHRDTDLLTFDLTNTAYLEIENILFEGFYIKQDSNTCTSDACTYCPNVSINFEGKSMDDRENEILDYMKQTYCTGKNA